MEYVSKDEFNRLQKELSDLKAAFYKDNFISEQIFNKRITFKDRVDFKGDTAISGTKIGFYDKAPIAQQNTIASPTGGLTVDSQARNTIGEVITALKNIGIIKSS